MASRFIPFSFTNALVVGYVRVLEHDIARARKDPFEYVRSDFGREVEEVAAGPTRKFARSHFYLRRATKRRVARCNNVEEDVGNCRFPLSLGISNVTWNLN